MRTRNFVAGLVAAGVALGTPSAAYAWKDPGQPGPLHQVIPAPRRPHPFGAFGPRWHRVPGELADALVEGGWPQAAPDTARGWMRCAVRVGDTTVIVCPNGFTTTS